MTREGDQALGALCPTCSELLRDTLRYERAAVLGGSDDLAPQSVLVTFCGSCGTTLATMPERAAMAMGRRASLEVSGPEDELSLTGQFHTRCRDLVTEIKRLGFEPGGWTSLINEFGGVQAAKRLLGSGRILPVTSWLIQRGRPDLTMEHEIGELRWEALFTDDDREQARRRLANPQSWPPVL